MTTKSVSAFSRSAILLFSASLVLSGCNHGKPEGQVVATVDGKEITERDLGAELASANLPAGVDVKALTPALLDKVITREIVAGEGRRLGLDKSPDFIALQQRASEVILAEQAVRSWAKALPAPDKADIDAFVTANPRHFDGRELIQVQEFTTGPLNISPQEMAPIHSMDAIAALLDQHKVPFQRGERVLDTLNLDNAFADRLANLTPGDPFIITGKNGANIIAVTHIQPAPLPADARIATATDALRKMAIDKKIAALKAGTKVDYRADLKPKPVKGQ